MQTVFDWLSMALFLVLIVVFLERSTGDARTDDRLWHYVPPAMGCVVINLFGNEGLQSGSAVALILAVSVVLAVILYGRIVMKIRSPWPR